VKTTRDRVTLFRQPVEGLDGFPRWFFDQFDIIFFKVFAQKIRNYDDSILSIYSFLKPLETNFVKKITGYKRFQNPIYGPRV